MKVKLGIKIMKFVESLIGWDVSVGQGSECYLTFVKGILHIAEWDPKHLKSLKLYFEEQMSYKDAEGTSKKSKNVTSEKDATHSVYAEW